MSLDDVVIEVADRLRASVVMVDCAFTLITYSTQSAEVDKDRVTSILARSCPPDARTWFEGFGIKDTAGPIRIPENLELEASSRICLPARYGGNAYGYLFVLPDQNSTVWDTDLEAAMPLVDYAGEQLARAARDRDHMAVAVADLLTGDRQARKRATARIGQSGHFSESSQVAVLAVDGRSPLPARPALSAPIGSLTAIIIPNANGAVDLVRSIVQNAVQSGALVGIGEECPNLRAARRGWHQAKLGLRVARHDAAVGPIAYWRDLGIYRLAVGGARTVIADTVLTPAVRALLHHRNVDLLVTAKSYLDHAGDTAATAADLGIHRQTLYYRLTKISGITGCDLSVGAQRLESCTSASRWDRSYWRPTTTRPVRERRARVPDARCLTLELDSALRHVTLRLERQIRRHFPG